MMLNYLSAIWAAIMPVAANHLWQSTLCVAIAGALTWVLRKNQARTRYWLWLAASVKFLTPFSLLVDIGSHLARSGDSVTVRTGFYSSIEGVSQPFTQSTLSMIPSVAPSTIYASSIPLLPIVLAAVWFCGVIVVFSVWCMRWRRISVAAGRAVSLREGREVEVLRRLEHKKGMKEHIKLVVTKESLEPGVFGIFRPVLLWPERISEHFEDSHLEAILAHEVWHIRRRDNLAAVMHMIVEAIFWFHPLVWWLGGRLVEERELSCDEEVLRSGNEPQVYAESILKTCKFCVESPMPCMSGVTGADLKNRIVRIMTKHLGNKLGFGKKLLLAVIGITVIAGPLMFGIGRGPSLRAQLLQATTDPLPSFEVASIKPSRPGDNNRALMMSPGKLMAKNQDAKELIKFAYNCTSDDQLLGGPNWINSDRYDVDAKEDEALGEALRKLPPEQRATQVRQMVQSLLADRFHLKVTRQTRQLPVYALVLAKNGPKLTQSAEPPAASDDSNPPGAKSFRGGGVMRMGNGQLSGKNAPIGVLVNVLSRQPEIGGRVIVDQTGLKGNYDWTLKWSPEHPGPLYGAEGGPGPANAAPPDPSGPSLLTALQEQLGLKLETQKGSVEVLVIDHIEKPTED